MPREISAGTSCCGSRTPKGATAKLAGYRPEEVQALPDDAVSPGQLDRLLATLDEKGISLVDDADVEAQNAAKEHGGGFEAPEEELETPEDEKEEHLKEEEDELLEKQLVGEEISRRIDDPIRMYLTQMGQIPLLTRNSEIALARKERKARNAGGH